MYDHSVLRALLIVLTLLAAATVAYLVGPAKTSFSSYSPDQLAALRAEAERVSTAGGPEQADARVSLSMVDDELERRTRLLLAGAAALLFAVAAFAALRTQLSVGLRSGKGEEARLASFLANASGDLKAGQRRAAAELLCVAVNAPRPVIEAAYEAQMKERDRSRYDGLAPDLVRIAEEQREKLRQARDVLLSNARS